MTKILEENGIIEYRNEQGELHRVNGPAVIWPNSHQAWYLNGRRHREDGPAEIWANGRQEWWQNGLLHREDGPAIIEADGTQFWFQFEQLTKNVWLHREDGPAVIWADGSQSWYLIDEEVDEELVNNLNSLTADLINKYDNVELRSWLIARMGWPKYLKEINAEPIDTRDNDVENTKEALYCISELNQNQLVVTCPTGRVFNLHVPVRIKTCEAAQRWLGNDTKKKFNVIGRT